MFGNLKGWIIAAVLAAVLVLLAYQATEFNRITPVTSLASEPEVLAPLSVSVSPASIVAMNEPGDGTALYRSAIDEVQKRKSIYEKCAEDVTSANASDLPAVQAVLDATHLQPSPILATNISGNIGYALESDEAKALALIGKCCEQLGALNCKTNPALSKKYFEAEISLGAKMFDERITFYEAFDALGMLRGGIGGLKILAADAKDDAEVTRLAAFDESSATLSKRLDRLWTVIGAVDDTVIATHAGDIYFFTGPEMKERMWRIESTLALGRHKYNAGGRLADMTAVKHRLAEMQATEKDPALLEAIKKADALTLPEYRMIR